MATQTNGLEQQHGSSTAQAPATSSQEAPSPGQDVIKISSEARELLEEYSGIAPNEVRKHVNGVVTPLLSYRLFATAVTVVSFPNRRRMFSSLISLSSVTERLPCVPTDVSANSGSLHPGSPNFQHIQQYLKNSAPALPFSTPAVVLAMRSATWSALAFRPPKCTDWILSRDS